MTGLVGLALSPAGRSVAVLLVLLAAYVKGGWDAGARCEAAALRGRIEAIERDAAIDEAARTDAERRAATLETRARTMEVEIADFEARLAAAADAACRLSDDDARRLRGLAR